MVSTGSGCGGILGCGGVKKNDRSCPRVAGAEGFLERRTLSLGVRAAGIPLKQRVKATAREKVTCNLGGFQLVGQWGGVSR